MLQKSIQGGEVGEVVGLANGVDRKKVVNESKGGNIDERD